MRRTLVVVLLLIGVVAPIIQAPPALAAPPLTPGGYSSPLDKAFTRANFPGWLSQGYGCPSPSGYTRGYYHVAADAPAASGSAVYAVTNGVVRNISTGGWGDGNIALLVEHTNEDGSRFVAVYGHIRNTPGLNAKVVMGQKIGTVGPWSGGTHLHFGVRPGTNAGGTNLGRMPCSSWPDTNGFVDPVTYLSSSRPAPASGLSSAEKSLARGDFNNDGFDDVAIGVPGENGAGADQGAVVVSYGGAGGLNSGRVSHQLYSDGGGLAGDTGAGDYLGGGSPTAMFW